MCLTSLVLPAVLLSLQLEPTARDSSKDSRRSLWPTAQHQELENLLQQLLRLFFSFHCSFLFFTRRSSTDSLPLFYHLLPAPLEWSLYSIPFLPLTDVFSSSCALDCTALSLLSHRSVSLYIHLSFSTKNTAWSVRRISTYLNQQYSLYFS